MVNTTGTKRRRDENEPTAGGASGWTAAALPVPALVSQIKATRLTKFFQIIQGFKAKLLAKAKAAPPPLPPPAGSHPGDVALVSLIAAPSVPPPSAPHVDDTSEWGCTRCRYVRSGCDRCNPHKVAAKCTGVPYPVSRKRGVGRAAE